MAEDWTYGLFDVFGGSGFGNRRKRRLEGSLWKYT